MPCAVRCTFYRRSGRGGRMGYVVHPHDRRPEAPLAGLDVPMNDSAWKVVQAAVVAGGCKRG